MASLPQSYPTPLGGLARLRNLITPSLFDLVVLSLPLWFFGLSGDVASALVSDGDTGWHIRAGDHILRTGAFIHEDLFSFHNLGKPWFAWEWLSDCIFSALHTSYGLKGVVWLAIVLSCLLFAITLRHMLWRGANLFVAVPLALVSFAASTVHLLARPHLWTLVLFAGSFWLVEYDKHHPSRRIWLLVPLTAVWANLHGGWLALIALLGLNALGAALEAQFGAGTWRPARRLAALAASCFAASLFTPYGWGLHRHMAEYLSASWVKDLVAEFKSPSFRNENMLLLELFLLVSVAFCALEVRKRRFSAPLLVLFWAHQALQSTRHVPLFLAIASPLLAGWLAAYWRAWIATLPKKSLGYTLDQIARDMRPALARASLWCVVPFFLLLPGWLPLAWPKDLNINDLPVAMATRHQALLEQKRLLTPDQWADYLLYHSPRQRSFMDGRSDYFGEAISRDYCDLLNASSRTPQLLEKYGLNAALVAPGSALASYFEHLPGWHLADQDQRAVLYLKGDR